MSISHPTTHLDEPESGSGPPDYELRNGIHYPSSDGVEMGESDWHMVAMTTLFLMLREHFADRDAYVAADLMFYYEEGNPSAVRSPDCMVVFGVKNHRRHSWLAWEENALPAIVFEIASKGTFREDLGAKVKVYEKLGIPEYVLFDPIGSYFGERRLRGYRLHDGVYREIETDDEDGLISEQLGLMIYPESDILRLVDCETLRFLRTSEETTRLYSRECERSAELKRATRALRRRATRIFKAERHKADAERHKAEAERHKADAERHKAEAERHKADAERHKAEAERRRADELAAEVERLRAMLGLKTDQ